MALAQDRIVPVYDEKAGWIFGGEEHTSAPEEVKRCIDEHEAVTFRQKVSSQALPSLVTSGLSALTDDLLSDCLPICG
jgi:hypothetical protein